MSQITDIFFDISINERKMKMTYQEKYELLIEKFIERKRISISIIQKQGKTSFKMANQIYDEWKKYHDEIFWHNAIYELSFMEEAPTVARIMNEFGISYLFATKILNYFLEVTNEP